jgi:hypothetical protein
MTRGGLFPGLPRIRCWHQMVPETDDILRFHQCRIIGRAFYCTRRLKSIFDDSSCSTPLYTTSQQKAIKMKLSYVWSRKFKSLLVADPLGTVLSRIGSKSFLLCDDGDRSC